MIWVDFPWIVFVVLFGGSIKKIDTKRVTDAYVRMILRAYEFSSMLGEVWIGQMEGYMIECDAFKEPKEEVIDPLKEKSLMEVHREHIKHVSDLVGKEYATGTLKKFKAAFSSLEAFMLHKKIADIKLLELSRADH